MSQEETKENFTTDEGGLGSTEENLNPVELAKDVTDLEDSQEIDNLPIESIGSYARLEELLTDEEKKNTTNPASQS